MRARDLVFLLGGIGAGMLVYGSLHGARHLVVERRRLRLRGWPSHLAGYRIAVLSDLHLQGPWSQKHCSRAVALAMDQDPDIVVIAGDFVENWKRPRLEMVREVLQPLALLHGRVVAVPGNHDYDDGDPDLLRPLLDELGIRLLRNQHWEYDGIVWVGIDSCVMDRHEPAKAMADITTDAPRIALWHEPDRVGLLPPGCLLQISGHTHGGQFRFPGGYTPMFSYLGRDYPEGFYPEAPTPLYVSRGVGVTGPPSRFNCPPEVSLLELLPAS
jgi:predicted MPP superfamily phosphohydrolase